MNGRNSAYCTNVQLSPAGRNCLAGEAHCARPRGSPYSLFGKWIGFRIKDLPNRHKYGWIDSGSNPGIMGG